MHHIIYLVLLEGAPYLTEYTLYYWRILHILQNTPCITEGGSTYYRIHLVLLQDAPHLTEYTLYYWRTYQSYRIHIVLLEDAPHLTEYTLYY